MTHLHFPALGPAASLGLLVLRATLCCCMIWIVAKLSSGQVAGLLGCLCSILLSVGYKTRLAAVTVAAVLLVAWYTEASPLHAIVLSGCIATALALTGPGRYSADAWRSARRIVVVSRRRRR